LFALRVALLTGRSPQGTAESPIHGSSWTFSALADEGGQFSGRTAGSKTKQQAVWACRCAAAARRRQAATTGESGRAVKPVTSPSQQSYRLIVL